MKLSEAIEIGASVMRTEGPQATPAFIKPFNPVGTPTPMMMCDVLTAAQYGLLGRVPTQAEYLAFYWSNPWGATHNTPLLNWMRGTEAHRYRWADVIKKLKEYGA